MSLVGLLLLACLVALASRLVRAQQRAAAALESIAAQLETRRD